MDDWTRVLAAVGPDDGPLPGVRQSVQFGRETSRTGTSRCLVGCFKTLQARARPHASSLPSQRSLLPSLADFSPRCRTLSFRNQSIIMPPRKKREKRRLVLLTGWWRASASQGTPSRSGWLLGVDVQASRRRRRRRRGRSRALRWLLASRGTGAAWLFGACRRGVVGRVACREQHVRVRLPTRVGWMHGPRPCGS